MKTIRAVLSEPIIVFQMVCYAGIMLALVAGSNSLQDAVRQRQFDASEAHVIQVIRAEADRVIEAVRR